MKVNNSNKLIAQVVTLFVPNHVNHLHYQSR
jgi:hypothetical protein